MCKLGVGVGQIISDPATLLQTNLLQHDVLGNTKIQFVSASGKRLQIFPCPPGPSLFWNPRCVSGKV